MDAVRRVELALYLKKCQAKLKAKMQELEKIKDEENAILLEGELLVLMKRFLTFLSFQPKMFSGFRVILDHRRDHFCHPLNHIGSKRYWMHVVFSALNIRSYFEP